MANCDICGCNLDLIGKTHRCISRSAPAASAQQAPAPELTGCPGGNAGVGLDTYRYRDADKRRAYMRELMRKRRRGQCESTIRVLAVLLLLTSAARAQVTQSQVTTSINSQLPTNGLAQIQAVNIRTVLDLMNTAIFQSFPASTPSSGDLMMWGGGSAFTDCGSGCTLPSGLTIPLPTITAPSANPVLFQLTQDSNGSRVEFQKTNFPSNFSGTRGGLIWQLMDTQSVGSGAVVPAWEFVYTWSGNGVVTVSPNSSSSVDAGFWVVGTKTGDGSGQEFTCTGQLGTIGPTGYNENGCFQGQLTNIGSTNGNLSFLEGYVADGVYGTAYQTTMKFIASRMVQYDASSTSTMWLLSPGTPDASSHGYAIGSIMSRDTSAVGSFIRGIDLSGLTFTSGIGMLIPNAVAIEAVNALTPSYPNTPLLELDASNNTNIGVISGQTIKQLVYNSSTGATSYGPWSVSSAGIVTGAGVVISGSSSGAVTIGVQAAAGTYNFNLPTTAGTSGYVLTSAGGGSSAMTWTQISGVYAPLASPTFTGTFNIGGISGAGAATKYVCVDSSGNMLVQSSAC